MPFNAQSRLHAGHGVALHDFAARHLVAADAAVVRTLGSREPSLGPAQRTAVLEEGVFLLNAEHRLLVGVLLGHGRTLVAGVGRVGRQVGQEDLAHDELVALVPQRVRAHEDRLQHTVRVVAGGLVSARTVESPDARLFAVLDDPGLTAQERRRLRTVDPDVFGLVAHEFSRAPLRLIGL